MSELKFVSLNQNVISSAFIESTFETPQPLKSLGSVSPVSFDGQPVSFSCVEHAECYAFGVLAANRVLLESTLLGLNPNMVSEDGAKLYLKDAEGAIGSGINFGDFSELAYCINSWDSNYQHFIVETLPRIHVAQSQFNCPIVVSDQPHIREILGIAYPDISFVYLNNISSLRARRVYVVLPIGRNFEPLVEAQLRAIKWLRERAIFPVVRSSDAGNVAYIGRLETSGLAGQARRIVNGDDVLLAFSEQGHAIHDFYRKTLAEKCWITSSYSVYFSPIGANLMNFIFSQNGAVLNIIDHPYFNQWEFFSNLLTEVGVPIQCVWLNVAGKASGGDDWAGNLNSPFIVDKNRLLSMI